MVEALATDPRAELRARLAQLDDADLRAQAAGELAGELAQAEVGKDRVPGCLCLIAAKSGRLLARRMPAGSWVITTPRVQRTEPRRWFTLDRTGHVMEALDWQLDGRLGRARIRLAGGGWLEVRPRAATHAIFGAADSIVARAPRSAESSAEPEPISLTVAGALDWAAIDHLPPLDRPGALPPGGGSALLTLIAGLLADEERKTVRYRGPYPTRALFDRLLTAFRPRASDVDAARDTFIAEAEATALAGLTVEPPIDFEPAPPERLLLAEGTLAHVRDGIEELIDLGRLYAVRDPLTTIWAGRSGLAVAGLAFLGEPLEEHLVLDPLGDLVARIDDRITGEDEGEEVIERPLDERWRRALAALLVAESATLLARPLLDLILRAPIAWGATDGRWVMAHAGGWLVHGALPARFRARHAAAPAAEREALAGRFVAEVARALGDPLRRAAQERVEAQVLDAAQRPAQETGTAVGSEALTTALLDLAHELAAGRAP